MGATLQDLKRCPHCSIASPLLLKVWASNGATPRTDGGTPQGWGAFICATCGGVTVAKAEFRRGGPTISALFPRAKAAHEDIPDVARTFLQQAFDTLHSPDAATVMAASAVDAMLKAKRYGEGSLYTRIDKALADNVLTKGMATWAHSVRLEANSVRHADEARPHASAEEARQTVEFAEALGNFLFVLTARVDRGIKAATSA
ncbi:DUF4145 domain-containing protein [Rhizobium rhizogenes]|uniref:DUF4145 domain-containing protein n=1 Tax=Rhizobium rhizogenes TaxID=359 RepID=UPI00080FC748|nr:DUF4145 domain-containing protein [Rhizobium rhizogenes]OCJ22399.1 hypothetical protein A6U88_29465 [Agrobacterium sp. B131/95]